MLRFVFSLLIHCRNYDGFPGRTLRDVVITVTVNYRNISNSILGASAVLLQRQIRCFTIEEFCKGDRFLIA